jgi:hypothetical protein
MKNATRRATASENRALTRSANAMYVAMTKHAGNLAQLQKLEWVQSERTKKPGVSDLSSVFAKCRYYAQESSFLSSFLPLKLSILNYEFHVVPAGKDASKKNALKKLDEWLAKQADPLVKTITDPQTQEEIEIESNAKFGEQLAKFAKDAWSRFLLYDSVISMWLDDRDIALTLAPDVCTYSDKFAVETLKYQHGLTQAEIAQLLPEQAQRFARAEIFLNPKEGEHFKVLKQAAVGDGLGVPRLFSIFRLLGEVEDKEIGFARESFLLRNVTRFHQLGHEIKSGVHAGKSTYMWNPTRDKGVKDKFLNVEGVNDVTANFDHAIDFPWPDLKRFDDLAWRGTDKRLNDWGGSIAKMLQAKGVAPYLTSMVKGEAFDARNEMGSYLTFIINAAWHPPVEVNVVWSNLIFNEARLMMEMLKFAYQNGLSSVATTNKEFGLDDQEGDRKVEEADDPDAVKKFSPLYAVAQGMHPALGESTFQKQAGVKAPSGSPGTPAGGQHNS